MASLRSSSARKTVVSLATAAVLTTVLAACGGGSDSDGGSASGGGGDSAKAVTVAGVSIQKDDELAAMVPKDVAEKGELTAIVYDNAPADTFVDKDGKITGWGPEFGEAVSALLGLKWTPEASGAFDTFIPSIQNGRYITGPWASLTVLPERLKVVDIVAVHENSTGVMTAADSDLTIAKPEDLCGLNVAALAGSSFISQLETVSTTCTDAGLKKPTVKAYPQQAAAQLAVKNGRADAFATAKGQLAWLLREVDGFKLQPLDYQPALEGIGVSKTSGMTEAIAAAMDKLMEDGTYETILKKWDVDFGLLEKSEINPTS
jgi:polar amino acid transport system substrate-binding protein